MNFACGWLGASPGRAAQLHRSSSSLPNEQAGWHASISAPPKSASGPSDKHWRAETKFFRISPRSPSPAASDDNRWSPTPRVAGQARKHPPSANTGMYPTGPRPLATRTQNS